MIEDIKKIKLMINYFNQIENEYRKLLYNLNFMEWEVNWSLEKAENNGSDISCKDINDKIKEIEEILSYYHDNSLYFIKKLSEEEIKNQTTNYETDISYLEYYKEIIIYYEDLIFKTKDIINNNILDLIRNTLGVYYDLLAPLLPNYNKSISDNDWNIDNLLDFLIKFDMLKNPNTLTLKK